MIPSDLSPLWISLETSAAATALTFMLGVAAAAAMLRCTSRWRGFLDGVLTLPLVLPPTVVGFFLLLLFGRRSMVGSLLEQIGLTIVFSWPATVIAATVVAFPLMYRATLGAFEQVNPNLLGAARTLGAGEWRTFRHVLLPLAWPGVMAGTVLAFARALGEFGATLMFAGNIPGRTQTMPVAIFFAAEGGDMRRAMAWVLLIVALSLASITALNLWSRTRPSAARRTRAAEPPAEAGHAEPIVLTRQAHEDAAAGNGSELSVDVAKSYPDFALRAAFETRSGALGLLGPSGAGKSMILRCVAGLETPDRGRILLNGRVLFDAKAGVKLPPAQRRVGIVFQDYALFPHLTVRENIAFGLHGRPAEEQRQGVSRWARMMQIEPLLSRRPGELSGGQRQRVALARVLAMEPEALLLDEPFSALDPHLRRQLEEQLRVALEGFPGVTVFVTHDRDEAFRFCRDLAVVIDGKVASIGGKRELFAHPGSLAVARLTGCKNFAAMRLLGPEHIRVADWNCVLRVQEPAPMDAEFVGIRAHDLQFGQPAGAENTFPCWLVASVESPFETTLYLRLHTPPEEQDHPHLEAEISREQWMELARQPQPWQVRLEAAQLLLLS